MAERRTMDTCPQTDALRLIWFGKRTVPYVCLYMDQYVAPQGHHGWWSVDPRTGGMSPEWSEPREWQEIASETAIIPETTACPICAAPDMVVTRENNGDPNGYYIECTNVRCDSNIPRRGATCRWCDGTGLVEGLDNYGGTYPMETCPKCDGTKVQPLVMGRDWVECPVCEADEVQAVTTEAGTIISCTNMSCPSNVINDAANLETQVKGPN